MKTINAPCRKRYNWKSRERVDTIIDDSEQKKIQIDIDIDDSHGYDASNALVLPSAKRKTTKLKKQPPVKLLTKKHRKRLLKIAEAKEKKQKIESLIKALQEVQAKPKEMELFTSLQETQTLGRKVFLNPLYTEMTKLDEKNEAHIKPKHLKWKDHPSVKKTHRKELILSIKRKRLPNYAGYTSSSSDDSEIETPVIEESSIDNKTKCESETNEINNSPAIQSASSIDKMDQRSVINNGCLSSSETVQTASHKPVKRTKRKKLKTLTQYNEGESVREMAITGNENNYVTAKKKVKKLDKNIVINGLKKKKKKSGSEYEEKKVGQVSNNEENPVNVNKKLKNKTSKENKGKVKMKSVLICEQTPSNAKDKTLQVEGEIVENRESEEMEVTVNEVIEVEDNTKTVSSASTTKKWKILNRDPKVQKERLKLPILSEEHTVMEAINDNPVTIIVGQTGSGKTTQVPQFLYEAGYTSDGLMIGVTEPRRVAAVAMSERVSYEMGLSSKVISYQVRFEGNQSEHTQIKFMTDGILLKEIQKDFLLQKYSVIVIDEAHERNVQSDILIGLLSKLVRRRNSMGKPLKLVIMSATLRIEDFTVNKQLFKMPPPVVKIDARVFAVNIYFNRTTDPDYVSAAFRKVYNIHKQLPEGAILVFLTGQDEIYLLCEKLREVFPEPVEADLSDEENSKKVKRKGKRLKGKTEQEESSSSSSVTEIISGIDLSDLATATATSDGEGNLDEGEDQHMSENLMSFSGKESEQPLLVLPLYAKLDSCEQRKVFQHPPPGCRLCVVATNVAETSLTIPNVKYVVDSGKVKQKMYEPVTGVSSFNVMWISKASANQRAGRAGRVCNGYCYRLYSSAVFNDEFDEFAKPEILRKPIDDVVLLLKYFRIRITTFPFPTPPDPVQVRHSIKRLVGMGALKQNKELLRKLTHSNNKDSILDATEVTEIGEEMALIPVAPRFAKMISHSNQFQGIMPYIILLISALTYQDFLVDVRLNNKYATEWDKYLASVRMSWSGRGALHDLGDLMVIINAVLDADRNKSSARWCQQHGLRFRDVIEIRKLRQQLTKFMSETFPEIKLSQNLELELLTSSRVRILSQVVLTGSAECVAKKVNYLSYQDPVERTKWKNSYKILNSDQPVYISSLSVLHKEMPQFIMYQDIHRTTKTYLRGVTAICSSWLMTCAPLMCIFSPPVEKPPPRYNYIVDTIFCHRKATFGSCKWEIPEAEVPFPECKDLFKWVAYFLLKADLCRELKEYSRYLYDPETLIQPICIRYRELRENLISSLMARHITNRKSLQEAWKKDPAFLKKEYFAWFYNESSLYELQRKWPPLPESDVLTW